MGQAELSLISMPSGPGGVGILFFFAAIWGLVVTVFWMVVGWRAMMAHERLANAAEELARKGS